MRVYSKRRSNHTPKNIGTRGFPGGLQQISHPSAIKDGELAESRNVKYEANGVLYKRAGSLNLGVENGSKINSLSAAYDIGGSDYFIRISDLGIAQYYNESTEIWTNITGSPTFSDVFTNIIQAYGFVYFLNPIDPMVKWDGTSWLIFAPLANPTTAPVIAKVGAGTGTTTFYYLYVWYNEVGNTIGSSEGNLASLPVDLDDTTYTTVTMPAAPAGARYTGIFKGTLAGETIYLARVPATQTVYQDKGQDDEFADDNFLPPTSNTTAGFHFKYADVYRSTLIGVTTEEGGDTLVFSAGGDKFDSFGRADGGGFYAWRKGDGYDITGVRGFTLSNEDGLYVTKRDKIGVFRFDEAGGSVRDINLGIGVVSHLSLHAAGNNLRGWGEDGAVSIQNEANYANIIRTQIFSIKADRIAKSVTSSDLEKVCGAYYQGLTLYGLPTGDEGTGNNTVLTFDERFQAWSEWRGLTPAIFATFIGLDNKRKLFFGSSQSGDVVEMFRGKSDNGDPIIFRITTKQFDNDKPYEYKTYRKIFYIFGNVTGTSTTIRLFEDGVRALIPLALNANVGTRGMGTNRMGTIRMGTSTGTFTPDTSGLIVRYAQLYNKDLFSIQTTIENNGINDDISVVGVFIELSDSARELKYVNKLQRAS